MQLVAKEKDVACNGFVAKDCEEQVFDIKCLTNITLPL